MEVLYNICEVVASVCENSLEIWFLLTFFGLKNTSKYNILGFICFVLIKSATSVVFSILGYNEFLLSAIIFIGLSLLYCRIFLNGKLINHVLVSIISDLIILLTAICINYFSSIITQKSSSELLYEESADRIIALIFSKVVLFVGYKIILTVTGKNKTELKGSEWGAFCAVFASTLLSGICIYEERVNGINISGNSFFILPALCLILINIVTFYMIIKISKEHMENVRNAFLVAQIREQEASLDEMKSIYNDIKQIRHNISHQYGCIHELLLNKKYEQAEKYIEEIALPEYNATAFIDTDNDIINAILCYLLNRCNKEGIKLKPSIFSTDIECFSPPDISVIITNLVVNAVEACVKNGKSDITLELYNKKNYYCIRVKNLLSESVLKSNPNLLTTKKDKSSHGFGITTVKKLVEKYDGISNFSEKGGCFTSEVWLKYS